VLSHILSFSREEEASCRAGLKKLEQVRVGVGWWVLVAMQGLR